MCVRAKRRKVFVNVGIRKFSFLSSFNKTFLNFVWNGVLLDNAGFTTGSLPLSYVELELTEICEQYYLTFFLIPYHGVLVCISCCNHCSVEIIKNKMNIRKDDLSNNLYIACTYIRFTGKTRFTHVESWLLLHDEE